MALWMLQPRLGVAAQILYVVALPLTSRISPLRSVDSRHRDPDTIFYRASLATLSVKIIKVRGELGQPRPRAPKDVVRVARDLESSVNCTYRLWQIPLGVAVHRPISINSTRRLTTHPISINNKAAIQIRSRARAWKSAPKCKRHTSGSKRPLGPI